MAMTVNSFLLPTNYYARSYSADCLSCLHSSKQSVYCISSSVCWVPLKPSVSWRDQLRQTQLQPGSFTCLPTKEFGKLNTLDEKLGVVIQSVHNPLRALSGSSEESTSIQKSALGKKARFVAQRKESLVIEELERPIAEYMSLPASQYSVLDAERIERIDENTFRCYVYHMKFFSFEVCPVLLVRVEEQPKGCSIKLLSCKLEGSPMVVAQNEKFSASMVNEVSYSSINGSPSARELISDTTIEVLIDIPFPFQAMPVEMIESTGNQVLQQLLRVMLPRFLSQLAKDYRAWASGDTSRRPLGSGEI